MRKTIGLSLLLITVSVCFVSLLSHWRQQFKADGETFRQHFYAPQGK
ncbi:MAG TPA: hypothetical protein VGE35_01905 [Candidatus Paceibacterota bacterium]